MSASGRTEPSDARHANVRSWRIGVIGHAAWNDRCETRTSRLTLSINFAVCRLILPKPNRVLRSALQLWLQRRQFAPCAPRPCPPGLPRHPEPPAPLSCRGEHVPGASLRSSSLAVCLDRWRGSGGRPRGDHCDADDKPDDGAHEGCPVRVLQLAPDELRPVLA
jgi:hypothetical protein